MRRTYAQIYLNNLRHNVQILRKLHGSNNFFCPMVKANAYGHGDITVAKTLSEEGVENFGVVLVEEGMRLRKAGIQGTILVFGTYDRESLEEAVEFNLTPVISDFSQLELIKNIKKQTNVHIKFNTGMNRLGFDIKDAKKLHETLSEMKNLNLMGVCTHFLKAEDANEDIGATEEQVQKFKGVTDIFKNTQFHYLNSSALLQGLHKRYPAGARPGISIYGIKPALNSKVEIDLKPVMHLKSYIGQLHDVQKNSTVSYVGVWKASEDSLIATIPIGYADGYPRHFSNRSEMLFRGKRVKVCGIICMDYTMVDLTPFRNDKMISVGEQITVFGQDELGAYHSEEVARDTQSHPYELVTRISERVPRVVIDP